VSTAGYRTTMDVVGPRPRFLQPVGETEPDLHLIKQVEQVTTSALEGPA
jgi:hypothetical protein